MFQVLETWAEEEGISKGVHRVPVVSRRGTSTCWGGGVHVDPPGPSPWADLRGYVQCP